MDSLNEEAVFVGICNCIKKEVTDGQMVRAGVSVS